jgi:SAM-dependent methyltransferase
MKLISPVCPGKHLKRFLDHYLDDEKFALNIGSGNSVIAKGVVNVDIFAYKNVDIVCDIDELPFKDNTVDIILNIAALEHVPDPGKVIKEMHRILKPGGYIYTAFPFIQAFHASPYDFTRVTEEGIKFLHHQFKEIEVKPFGGPTSGLLWILQEWIAIVLSFGSRKLHLIIFIFVTVLTFPLKFLDYFYIRHPLAKNISSGFIYIGMKD